MNITNIREKLDSVLTLFSAPSEPVSYDDKLRTLAKEYAALAELSEAITNQSNETLTLIINSVARSKEDVKEDLDTYMCRCLRDYNISLDNIRSASYVDTGDVLEKLYDVKPEDYVYLAEILNILTKVNRMQYACNLKFLKLLTMRLETLENRDIVLR